MSTLRTAAAGVLAASLGTAYNVQAKALGYYYCDVSSTWTTECWGPLTGCVQVDDYDCDQACAQCHLSSGYTGEYDWEEIDDDFGDCLCYLS